MIATYILILLNCLVFLLTSFMPEFSVYLALNPYFFMGLYYQPLSSIFTHGGVFHLLMNMAVLYQFGRILEANLGSLKFSIIYLILGIFTSLISAVFVYFQGINGNFINLVGASGAICALLGILASVSREQAKEMFVAILIISFAPMLVGMQIAWYAHIIGFLLGLGYGVMKRGRR